MEEKPMDAKQLFKAGEYILITFPTTHAALLAEKSLEGTGIPFLTVPTPREISAGCGLAMRIWPESFPEVKLFLSRTKGSRWQEVYRVRKTPEKTFMDKVTE